jgi:hypothetical protein
VFSPIFTSAKTGAIFCSAVRSTSHSAHAATKHSSQRVFWKIHFYQNRIPPRAMLRLVDSAAARSFSSIFNPMGSSHWADPQFRLRRSDMIEFIVNVIIFIFQ